VKAKHALANLARSAALATMGMVIFLSLQAGVELVFAVVRGIIAFLVVHWVLAAAMDLIQVAAFSGDGGRRQAADAGQREQQSSEGTASTSREVTSGGR